MERLQKFLAHAGIASRRMCENIIKSGRVKVNGKTVCEPGFKIDPQNDKVQADGQYVKHKQKNIYLILNKPRGYVSTVKDERGRKTVLDLVKHIDERVYPVGRLDYRSEGLLILTNDGDLTYLLTHPKNKIPKTYRVRVRGVPSMDKLEKLASGVELEDGRTSPAKISLIDILKGNALLEITITEGKNRQIRKMCEHVGHPVLRLVRTRIGPLELRKLPSGKVRELTQKELKMLMKLMKTKQQK
ncbi:rRNA pseudouridine synthase [Peptococcaceae bacterium]|nr:rRNA pseudouridine synthase [Peptococcaceae bacterium]